MSFEEIINKLKSKGILFESGLSEHEIENIESFYNIVIPPDLNEFLSIAHPVSNNFINWRDMNENNVNIIRDRLNWPLEGMIFDIENNSFWYKQWGPKPDNIEEAIKICKKELEKVPKLIPICSHRYIPSEPSEVGNPVFSVYQTDIIYYGENLTSYLEIEFNLKKHEDINFGSIKDIRFWSELVS